MKVPQKRQRKTPVAKASPTRSRPAKQSKPKSKKKKSGGKTEKTPAPTAQTPTTAIPAEQPASPELPARTDESSDLIVPPQSADVPVPTLKPEDGSTPKAEPAETEKKPRIRLTWIPTGALRRANGSPVSPERRMKVLGIRTLSKKDAPKPGKSSTTATLPNPPSDAYLVHEHVGYSGETNQGEGIRPVPGLVIGNGDSRGSWTTVAMWAIFVLVTTLCIFVYNVLPRNSVASQDDVAAIAAVEALTEPTPPTPTGPKPESLVVATEVPIKSPAPQAPATTGPVPRTNPRLTAPPTTVRAKQWAEDEDTWRPPANLGRQ